MPRPASLASRRRATNITLPAPLLDEAREMNINVSQACEHGLEAAVLAARRSRWVEENREGFEQWNDYVSTHGLPLEDYRQF